MNDTTSVSSEQKPAGTPHHIKNIVQIPLLLRSDSCGFWWWCFFAKLCLTLLWPHGLCSPPGSSVHGISQARILEWVAISSSRGSSWSRDWTQVSCIACEFFTDWVTKEAPYGGTKCPWLCLMTTLLLFGLLWLFSFFYTFSHLSDKTYPLAKVFPQKKGRLKTWGSCGGQGGKNHRVLLCFTVEDISISIMVRQASKFEMESEKYFKARYKIKYTLHHINRKENKNS